MLAEINKLAALYNAQHGTPAEGHSSYCKINNINLTPDAPAVISLIMEESFHGRVKVSEVKFAAEDRCVDYLKFHTV